MGTPLQMTVRESPDRLRELVARLKREIRGSHAKAGILGTYAAKEHDPEDGKPAEPITMVKLAVVHEFGSPEEGIPERSFIRSSFDEHRGEYLQLLESGVKAVLEDRKTARQVLAIAGLKMVADIKNGITRGLGIPPPNSPATIAKKLAKGQWNIDAQHKKTGRPKEELVAEAAGQVRPLVDSGQLLNSITHEVVVAPGKAAK